METNIKNTVQSSDKAGQISKILASGVEGKNVRLKARKVRRVIRHIDPWSVLTFSVVFHLVVLGSLFVAGLILFVVANWFGIVDSFEEIMKNMGGYKEYDLQLLPMARAMAIFSAIMVLVSSILLVLLTVIFNLISDLVGGIRVTVVEEDISAAKDAESIQ